MESLENHQVSKTFYLTWTYKCAAASDLLEEMPKLYNLCLDNLTFLKRDGFKKGWLWLMKTLSGSGEAVRDHTGLCPSIRRFEGRSIRTGKLLCNLVLWYIVFYWCRMVPWSPRNREVKA